MRSRIGCWNPSRMGISSMHMGNLRRIGVLLLGMVVAAAGIKTAVDLAGMLMMEAQGPMHSDASTYALIGRGLLNGLKPYTDLFDAKPPGIYLIMAASLWLTQGEMLATWLQVGLFLAFPLLLAWCAYTESKGDRLETWIVTVLAFIGGTVLTLYAKERGGALQPEGFAFFFSMLYGVVLLKTGLRTWWSVVVAGVAMMASMGLKEPFLLCNIAIALLLTPSWKELPRTFFLPLAIAAVIGCVALLFLGLFQPYFGVHLPNMLIHRVQETTEYNPLWLRPLRSERMYADIVAFYPSGKFTGWMIIFLWMSTPLLLWKKRVSWKGALGTWTVMWSALITMNLVFRTLMFKGMYPYDSVFRIVDQTFSGKDYFWIALCLVGSFFLWHTHRMLLQKSMYTALIMYIAALAVAAGVAYHPNFFVFAVPAYGTLLLLAVRAKTAGKLSPPVLFVLGTAILLAGIFYYPHPNHVKGHPALVLSNYAHTREDTERLDALLDACGVERANVNIHGRSFTFSKHSPWGPLMGLAMPDYFPADHPYGTRTVENILQHAEIMIFNDDEFYTRPLIKPIVAQVEEIFTKDAPECAKPHLPFFEYTVLFRKGALQ